MKFRRMVLVLMAVVALSGALLSTALAAPKGQEAETTQPEAEQRSHAFLGLVTTALNDRIKRYLELPADVEGLGVMGTIAGSPADAAGFERADVVLSIDDVVLTTPRELNRFLNTKQPGDEIDIAYVREGERDSMVVTLGNSADFQPDGPPKWLTKLHKFMAAFPNAIDGTLRVLGDDGEVREYYIVPGTVVGVEESTVGIENRLGDVVRYDVTDETVVISGRHRMPLNELEEGSKVVILEIDDSLKAIVLMGEHDGGDRIRPNEIDAVPENPRRQVVEGFRNHMSELREEFRVAKDPEQVGEVVDQLRTRILQLQDRLAGVNGKAEVS